MLSTLSQVALGGAIGASLRHLCGVAAMRLIGPGFPWATLAVNLAGCFAMGLLAGLFALHGGQRWAPFLMTGVLGGFTTFSAFSLDAVTLWQRGAVTAASAYVLGSVVLSLAALLLGLAMARAA